MVLLGNLFITNIYRNDVHVSLLLLVFPPLNRRRCHPVCLAVSPALVRQPRNYPQNRLQYVQLVL